MTKPHRATPEQWDDAGAFASDTRACILELRARIEDLEDDALEQSRSQEFCLDHVIQRLEKLEAAQRAHIDREDLARPATFAELLMPPPRTTTPITRDRDETGDYLIVHDTLSPADSLVDRVADALMESIKEKRSMARAAIFEVAAWLTENYASDAYVVGPPPHQMLRDEANR